ncbi:unnamed protein product (macronuclear) [Paramecium tetraurelia]|uniref:Uncharacterized protein n=1 Tax=Paramecium tetraurelia TaxID=5888 RepID=A0CBQ4_PARTE|nr:uncharacterized protein GSPATT00037004001 [Paramecium tetraurelia]CAK68221.1 unnamed protein product [Paramecium tetraurelia]|eukprot:XP_001435618.1 hypothetical protein (macronuclear) [Paramecium tetraurelia strain d4-2]
MIEDCELDQIIGTRNQFGPNRYIVVSESLFFESYELCKSFYYQIVQQSAQLINIQKENEKNSTLEKNDRFIIFATSILRQQAFEQHMKFNSQQLEQYRQGNQASVIISTINKLIKENIDPTTAKKKDELNNFQDKNEEEKKKIEQQRREAFIQENCIIIIELEQTEIYEMKKKNSHKLQAEDFLKFLETKSKDNVEFWENQSRLRQVYSKEISKLMYNPQIDETYIYITRRQISINDIRSQFEQQFQIKQIVDENHQQVEELYQDIINIPTQRYVPLIIYNQLFRDQVINPILELAKQNRQVSFQTIQTCLGFAEFKPIEVFLKLIETVENCRDIIRWINLLQRHLEGKSVQKSSEAVGDKDQIIYKVREYLMKSYKQLDKRFQDEFLDAKKEDSYDKFLVSKDNMENTQFREQQQEQIFSNTYFSLVLYEIKENFLMLYQNFKIGAESFNVIAKLEFFNQNKNEDNFQTDQGDPTSKAKGNNPVQKKKQNEQPSKDYPPQADHVDINQISLIDKEEGKTVYTLKFQLKEEHQQLVQTKNEQYRNLIMDVLIRTVTIKVKQTMYNPQTRKFALKITQFVVI